MRDLVRKSAVTVLFLCLIVAGAGTIYARGNSAKEPPQSAAATQQKSSVQPGKPAEKHSSPEDRQRLVAIAHQLEASPRDPALAPERQWAVNFVITAPDMQVRVCANLLSDLRRPKYKYRSELNEQLLISSAAFVIEHPDQADNYRAQSVGGMEGVLKAYTAIVKAEPQATAKSLNALLEKQREGKLADAVWEIVKSCQ